jgi:hypothetical protein
MLNPVEMLNSLETSRSDKWMTAVDKLKVGTASGIVLWREAEAEAVVPGLGRVRETFQADTDGLHYVLQRAVSKASGESIWLVETDFATSTPTVFPRIRKVKELFNSVSARSKTTPSSDPSARVTRWRRSRIMNPWRNRSRSLVSGQPRTALDAD